MEKDAKYYEYIAKITDYQQQIHNMRKELDRSIAQDDREKLESDLLERYLGREDIYHELILMGYTRQEIDSDVESA